MSRDTTTSPTAPAGRVALDPDDARADWGPSLHDRSTEALAAAERRLGLSLDRPVRVVTFANPLAFQRYLGSKPTHVVAVARSARNEIVIDRSAFHAQSPDEQRRTLIHEMAHLILGRRVAGELPAWLNEGLAMLAAGETYPAGAWRLSLVGTLGEPLPLARLERGLLMGGESQALAYAQSLSVTRFYLTRLYGAQLRDKSDPAPLARDLADPVRGPVLLSRLWDPDFRTALETEWLADHRGSWSWITVLTGSGLVWGLASGLLLLAWWRKRRFAQLKRERFADEESTDRALGLDIPPWEYESQTGEAWKPGDILPGDIEDDDEEEFETGDRR